MSYSFSVSGVSLEWKENLDSEDQELLATLLNHARFTSFCFILFQNCDTMPPTRNTHSSRGMTGNTLLQPRGVLTRSKRTTENVVVAGKRKAVNSPPKEKAVKRSAFGDLTNVSC